MLLDPSPVTNCYTFSDTLPSCVTYFMDDPLNDYYFIYGRPLKRFFDH